MNGNTQEGRAALLARGFEPLLIKGKACYLPGWTVATIDCDQLDRWERYCSHGVTATGLRTGRLVATDIDLLDPDMAEAVGDTLQGVLGLSEFRREGRKGFVLVYRNSEEPLAKITVSGLRPGQEKREKVEILGEGQQFVAFGPHAETGIDYHWPDRSPAEVDFEELPAVSRQEVRRAAQAVRDKLEELGFEEVEISGDLDDSRGPVEVENLQPVTPEIFEALWSAAQLDPSTDRLDWLGWLAVIKETPLVDSGGQEVEDFDRLAFAVRYSSGEIFGSEPGNYLGEADVEAVYNSLGRSRGRSRRRTIGSLVQEARRHGYQGPVYARTVEELEAIKPAESSIARYYAGQGLQVVVDNAARKLEPEEVEERRPFKLRSETEQDRAPDPVWLIPGVLQEETLALFYGPENSFKSFLVLDLALSAAAGLPWASYGAKPEAGGYPPSRPLTVVYVAGEGSRAIEKVRRPAWRASRGVDRPLSFYTVEAMPEFRDVAQVEALVEEIETSGVDPDVIVIDTLARAMTGLDENSAKDTGILVAGLDHLKRRFRCSVIGIHHSGKDAQKGARGSTNLPASFDARFAVSADRAALVGYVRNEKQKDGEPLEGRLVFKGYQEHGSLVFRCEPPAPGAAMSKDDERVEEVRAALAAMGADERLIATNWLAEKIVETRLEKDPAARDKTTDQDRDRMLRNESRNLQRQVKDRADGSPGFLRQFIVGATEGGDLSWTLPQVEEGDD